MFLPLLGLFASDVVTFAPGTSAEFQDTVRQVSASMEKGDKAKATRLLNLLPTKSVTYSWDEKAIPAAMRADFAKARDRMFREMTAVFATLTKVPAAQAQVQFSFAPVLGKRPQDANPLGVALFFNEKATPRMEAVIGLKRGMKGQTIDLDDVRGAVRYALARYLGLSEQAQAASQRPDLPGQTWPLTNNDFSAIAGNFKLVDSLRKAIQENKPVATGVPQISIDPAVIEIGEVTQGDKVPFSVQITNTGTAPLSYVTKGDCGCVVGTPPGVIAPGGVALIRPHVDSTEYVGKLVKALIVTTNDPERPTITIPVKLNVKPLYRFLTPQGSTILLDDSKTKDIYLVLADGRPLNILQVRFDGIPIKVTPTEWEGELPDPGLNEPSKKRKGLKLHLEVTGETIPGRAMGSLTLITDHDRFRVITTTIYAQTGIVASPDDLYIGALGSVPKSSTLSLSRPGKAFKVLGVESDNPRVTATFEALRPDEVRLKVEYDGKATTGDVVAKLKVKTDDPKQPVVRVTVRGFVP
ncbi:DUF1573 domain-containing protein [bacterium]|nr:MAG: DUF1573 domain-containing protein [bacterium]